jgi:hypothetical protein
MLTLICSGYRVSYKINSAEGIKMSTIIAGREIIDSKDKWTKIKDFYFRFWDGKLFRKEINDIFYDGYQIKCVHLNNRSGFLVAEEWVS